jgi:hypothetical protein
MKTFIAALSLLALMAVASSVISLRDHRHVGQTAQSISPSSPSYASGVWDRSAK